MLVNNFHSFESTLIFSRQQPYKRNFYFICLESDLAGSDHFSKVTL